jgi:hypothetical protein
MIRRLRLIVYHHNLHLWYRVVYIGGIWVLLKVLSRWHKRNIWFLHFHMVIWPNCFSQFKHKFSFQFRKWKFSKFSFQIFSLQIFVAYFFISHWWYGRIFSNFTSNFKTKFFFQFFPFSSHGMASFFSKFKNKKIYSKFQKLFFFKVFYFKFSLWHKWIFSKPEIAKFIKRL